MMLQCEISEELMDRVKNFERKLMNAFDFASFTEETMKEFMMEAATINSELLSYADEKGPF